MATKPCPKLLCLHTFLTPLGILTPQLPWQPILMPGYFLRRDCFPNIYLMRFQAICSHPTARYLQGEAKPHLAMISFLVAVESNSLPSASSSPGETIPVALAIPHKTCSLGPLPALLPFSGDAPVPLSL